MKYLVGIPCLFGVHHTLDAIESVVHKPDTDVLLIDNGAEISVKELLVSYKSKPNVTVIHNEKNVYVNPAWNQIVKHFIVSNSDYLIILNSDITLHRDWKDVLDATLKNYPYMIPVPVITDNKGILHETVQMEPTLTEVFEGTPGVMIVLNKVMATRVYPIPDTIKIWFGDNWIYEGLRRSGYHTFVLNNLLAYHYHSGSQNVSRLPEAAEIIEQDKIAWAKLQSE